MEQTTVNEFMSTHTTSTISPDDPGMKSWLDFVLPIMASGFFLLLLISFFGYFMEFFKESKCYNCFRRRNRSSGASTAPRNPGNDNADFEANGEDLPPSYSVARFGQTGFEVFQVVAEDESEIITSWPANDTGNIEKLPSYFEIMEAKKREAEQSKSLNNTRDVRTPEQSRASITTPPHTPIDIEADTDSVLNRVSPPPYNSVSSDEIDNINT